jgi:hypothetical protein
VWFGVLLCVNMQTSFMHPPFGFALFYLRGVADQVHKNGAISRPVASRDIYLGAIPWVGMQLLLVAIVIFWPESVTSWLDKGPEVNLDEVHIEMQIEDTGVDAEPAMPDVPAPAEPAGEGPVPPAAVTTP